MKLNRIAIFTFYSFLFIGIGFFSKCESNDVQTPTIFPLTKKWEKVVPHQQIPEGLSSLSAKDCGVCHKEHYEEWKHSTHSHAWTDMQFQSEIKKENSPFFCINCHIPLQNQQEYIVSGMIDNDIFQPVMEPNPQFDRELQSEGITCVACHVRNNAIIGTTGMDNAPHKSIKDPGFLSETLCIGCHTANATVTSTVVCSFETGDEWKSGPYAKEKNCISCHMEETEREMVPGYGTKKNHFHFFAGSGIPKVDTAKTKGLNGLEILVDPVLSKYPNDSITFNISLENKYAGHSLPTGDPERHFLISIEIRNDKDSIVEQMEEKIGETWEWYPEAKKIDDNNLKPYEKRNYSLSFLPATKGKYAVTFKVTKHRLNKESAHFNQLPESYPLFIPVLEETKYFNVK